MASDKLPDLPEFAEEELITHEREAIGFHLSGNPFTKYAWVLKEKRAKAIVDLDRFKNQKVIIGGTVKQVKQINTKKNGDEMVFTTITDFTGEIEMVVFPKLYQRTKKLWVLNSLLLIKGIVQEKDHDLTIVVEDVVSLKAYDKKI